MRPMLYGARYEAQVAARMGGGTRCHVVGKHCESGDVLVRDADLADPRPGDVLVIPATGAYGHAMVSQYNGALRPPVVFVKDGRARLVVRRDSYEDLLSRDV
jgi:diaminopimelate decarboxylase